MKEIEKNRASEENRPDILIVDDDSDFASSLHAMLRVHKYSAQLAFSEEDALKYVHGNSPELILIDVRLGKSDGVELMAKIKALLPGSVCIMITGFGSIDNAVQAIKRGAYDYLRKPVEPQDLIVVLERAYEKIKWEKEKESFEDSLKEGEQHINASFQQAAVGIAHVSLKGDFLLCNEKFCQTLGYAASQINKKSFEGIIHPNELSGIKIRMDGLLDQKESYFSLETQLVRADGGFIWANLTVSPVVSAQDLPAYFICFLEDITFRKESEKELQRLVDILGQKNNELREFAYITPHVLLEPLRKIKSFSKRLLETSLDKLDEYEQTFAFKLQIASTQLEKLVDELIEFSKISSQEGTLSKVDLGEIVERVLSKYDVQIKNKRIEVSVDALPVLYVRKNNMMTLFEKLIENAIKFSRKDVDSFIKITCQQPSESVYDISILDNGIGIDSGNTEMIFEPFKKLHANTKYPGNGLGLTTCRKIMSVHGGEISVVSELGSGAEVIVHIPTHPNGGQE